jgi:hypothetical protein
MTVVDELPLLYSPSALKFFLLLGNSHLPLFRRDLSGNMWIVPDPSLQIDSVEEGTKCYGVFGEDMHMAHR